MTNKLVVIINSLKVPKIKKILLYELKFLVPNYSCLQYPWLGGCRPPYHRSVCPLSSAEFVEPPRTNFLGTPLQVICHITPLRLVNIYRPFERAQCLYIPDKAFFNLLETSVTAHQSTRRNIREDQNLHIGTRPKNIPFFRSWNNVPRNDLFHAIIQTAN